MKQLCMTLGLWIAVALTAGAQTFDDDFKDSTLRLDYVLAGNAAQQHIYYCNASKQARWAGRRARLTEMPLRGNGQITLTDHATGRLLYVHTFSTLFQEWQATEEATHVDRAFQTSFNVPMPKHPVDVRVTLTDFHAAVRGELRHTMDPADVMIRRIDAPHEAFRYVWTGQTLPDGQPDVASCIDLAIIAEGYTREEMDKFYKDSRRAAEALFAHEPFTSMKSQFNVVAVAAESTDSGPSVPHYGLWRQTPVGAHYNTFYSDRYLMTSHMHRVYDLLDGIPFEHVIVLVNSSTYGGGGIYNQLTVTTSDHPTFRQVLVHEFGHAYGGLGDEYFYDEGFEPMYPADTEPWEPNLTTLVDFQSKWADMLDVPGVGVFEGGGNQSKGVYRPAQACRMKVNEVENFCPVCSRALVRITDFYTSH